MEILAIIIVFIMWMILGAFALCYIYRGAAQGIAMVAGDEVSKYKPVAHTLLFITILFWPIANIALMTCVTILEKMDIIT